MMGGCSVYAYRLSVELAFVSKVFGLAALYGTKFITSSLVTIFPRLRHLDIR